MESINLNNGILAEELLSVALLEAVAKLYRRKVLARGRQ